MMLVAIRPATPADIPAIARIYAHAVKHGTASFELEAPDQAEMTRRQRELIDAGFPYIAAELDGRLLGYAYAGPYRARPAYRLPGSSCAERWGSPKVGWGIVLRAGWIGRG